MDAMAEVGTERPVATADRVVQLGGRVAVVDEQRDAAPETRGGVRDPAVEREADLGALAVGEDDALALEPRRERRVSTARPRRRRSRRRAEPTKTSRRAPPRDDDAVGRERVEHLVGEDDAVDRLVGRRRRVEAPTRRARRPRNRRRSPRAAPPRPRPAGSGWTAARSGRSTREAVEDRERQRAGPRSVLAQDERRRVGRVGPRRPRRPGRAPHRRSDAPPGRSGSRRRDRAAPPPRGSSRRPGHTARGP